MTAGLDINAHSPGYSTLAPSTPATTAAMQLHTARLRGPSYAKSPAVLASVLQPPPLPGSSANPNQTLDQHGEEDEQLITSEDAQAPGSPPGGAHNPSAGVGAASTAEPLRPREVRWIAWTWVVLRTRGLVFLSLEKGCGAGSSFRDSLCAMAVLLQMSPDPVPLDPGPMAIPLQGPERAQATLRAGLLAGGPPIDAPTDAPTDANRRRGVTRPSSAAPASSAYRLSSPRGWAAGGGTGGTGAGSSGRSSPPTGACVCVCVCILHQRNGPLPMSGRKDQQRGRVGTSPGQSKRHPTGSFAAPSFRRALFHSHLYGKRRARQALRAGSLFFAAPSSTVTSVASAAHVKR